MRRNDTQREKGAGRREKEGAVVAWTVAAAAAAVVHSQGVAASCV